MFKVKANLTGQRVSGATQAEVLATSTEGNIRLNALTARQIGLKAGDYVGILELEGEQGETVLALFVGAKEQPGTSKLAYSNGKMSSTLQFSSASAWVSLKGSTENLKAYKLEDKVETGDEVYPTAYPLTFVEEREKIVRGQGE